jgi:hypothetical protein
MKINEIVQEGVLGSVGKGLADIVAPGAVEKYQAAKVSQEIAQQKNTLNVNGNIYKLTGQPGNYQWVEVSPQGITTPVSTKIQNQLNLLSGRDDPRTQATSRSSGKSSIVVPPYRKPRSTTTYDTPTNTPVTRQPSAPQQQTTPSGIIIPPGARTATPQTQTATVTPVITPKTKIAPQRNSGVPTPDEQAKFQAKLKSALDAQK